MSDKIRVIYNVLFSQKDNNGNFVARAGTAGISAFKQIVGMSKGKEYRGEQNIVIPKMPIDPRMPIPALEPGQYKRIEIHTYFNSPVVIWVEDIALEPQVCLQDLFISAIESGHIKEVTNTSIDVTKENIEEENNKLEVDYAGKKLYIEVVNGEYEIEDAEGNTIQNNSKEGKAAIKAYLKHAVKK